MCKSFIFFHIFLYCCFGLLIPAEAQYGRAPSEKLIRTHKIFDLENYYQIPLTASENYLVGKVKTVAYKEYDISLKDGKPGVKLNDTGFNVYDRDGRLIDQLTYTPDGSYSLKCTYRYEGAKAIEWDAKIDSKDWKIDARTTFKYDKKGNKIEQITIDKDTSKSQKTVFKYDSKNQKTAEVHFSLSGKLMSTTAYKYDSSGKQVECTESMGDGKIFYKLTCEYDRDGNKIAGGNYNLANEKPAKWTRKNDVKGRCTEMTDYKSDGSFDKKTIYTYDDKDNVLLQISYNEDGTVCDKCYNVARTFEYDTAGNITKYTCYKIEGGKRLPQSYTETRYSYY